MREIRTIDQVVHSCEIDSRTDYTAFWELYRNADLHFGLSDPASVKEKTLEIVSALLCASFMVGDVKKGVGFVPWESQIVEQIIDKISMEWDALGRPPGLGDICWFYKDPAK